MKFFLLNLTEKRSHGNATWIKCCQGYANIPADISNETNKIKTEIEIRTQYVNENFIVFRRDSIKLTM